MGLRDGLNFESRGEPRMPLTVMAYSWGDGADGCATSFVREQWGRTGLG